MARQYKSTYSVDIGEDNTIPDDVSFNTALSLPKKTYIQIDSIRKITTTSRSAVIALAVERYFNYLSSPDYINDLNNKLIYLKGDK